MGLRLGETRNELYKQIDSLLSLGLLKQTTEKFNSLNGLQRFEFNLPLISDTIKCEFFLENSSDNFYNNRFYKVRFSTYLEGNITKVDRQYDELLQLFYHKYNTPTEIKKELVFKYPEYHWLRNNLSLKHSSNLSEVIPLKDDKYAQFKHLVVDPSDTLKNDATYSKTANFDYVLLNIEAALKDKVEEIKKGNETREIDKKSKQLDSLAKSI